jgi:hypothetical protein
VNSFAKPCISFILRFKKKAEQMKLRSLTGVCMGACTPREEQISKGSVIIPLLQLHLLHKRKAMLKKFLLCGLAAVSFFAVEAQTIRTPAPSPSQTIKQEFGIGSIELT